MNFSKEEKLLFSFSQMKNKCNLKGLLKTRSIFVMEFICEFNLNFWNASYFPLSSAIHNSIAGSLLIFSWIFKN